MKGGEFMASSGEQTVAKTFSSRELEKQRRVLSAQKGDRAAFESVIEEHRPLVAKIASRYTPENGFLSFDDLLQEGLIGLIKAISKFRTGKGAKFSTFATYDVKDAIIFALRDVENEIRIPENWHQEYSDFQKEVAEIVAQIGSSDSEILIETLGFKVVERAEEIASLRERLPSLDQEVGNKNGEGESILLDYQRSQINLENMVVETLEMAEVVEQSLGILESNERYILSLFLGFKDGVPHCQDEIAEQLGRHRSGICQIVDRALTKLRQPSAETVALREIAGVTHQNIVPKPKGRLSF